MTDKIGKSEYGVKFLNNQISNDGSAKQKEEIKNFRKSKLELVAIELVLAWESLAGNTDYSPSAIQKWLSDDMKPAIDKLRKELNLPIPKA